MDRAPQHRRGNIGNGKPLERRKEQEGDADLKEPVTLANETRISCGDFSACSLSEVL